MNKVKILWVDDEIDLLKPHILFLTEKGYALTTVNNGSEAIDLIDENDFDIIFLDENMPGLSGIETLSIIKTKYPSIPVVMITKSEEEAIMEEAIGSKIADYLIKPVNPNQILLCLKKNLDLKRLLSEKTTSSYQQDFRNIGIDLTNNLNVKEWIEVYKRIVRWELELEQSGDMGMNEVLHFQKKEANTAFYMFIEKNYAKWLSAETEEKPVMSHTVLREELFPILNDSNNVYLIVLDNMRYDQWKILQPTIEELFKTEKEEIYYAILPTTTQYARNALFAGLLPTEIEKKYPKLWIDEDEEGAKNSYEKELLAEYLKRYGNDMKFSYNKILNLTAGRKLVESMSNLNDTKLNVIVYNFVDMLSHARTDMQVIRELVEDESAYRSLTLSWFKHSPLYDMMKYIADKKGTILFTTDHGSIRVSDPVKVIGDKNTNANLRYKFGKNLQYNRKEVYEIRNPADIYLPRINVSTAYIFCRNTDFFAYPNKYNYYVKYYRDTFQHGGISLEEMLIPVITLKAR